MDVNHEVLRLQRIWEIPQIDPTEVALHRLFEAIGDFEDAVHEADCPGRIGQLRERLRAAGLLLTRVQDMAADRHDAITKEL